MAEEGPQQRSGLAEMIERRFPAHDTATAQLTAVDAPPAATAKAIRRTDLSHMPVVRALVRIRRLPEDFMRLLGRRRREPPPLATATIDDLIAARWWVVVDERPGEAILLGLVMWDPRLDELGQSRELFEHPGPGAVRVGWGLATVPYGSRRSLLVTETRTSAADEGARRRFRVYWSFIGPFAALTRRLVINRIKAEAESIHAAG